jgi:Sulfotransferase family
VLPNFIVIGAAKAGTTALYWYLEEHPEVFMSPVKETNYFAYGLDENGSLLYGDPDVHRFPIKTRQEYEDLFRGAGGARAIGEASPIYLECPQAAGRIRDLLPGVQLICSIRHPVDRAYSDYLMYLRRRGRRFDPDRQLTASSEWARPDSRWMQVSRYHQQLSRYFAAFPRDQIHVIVFDDLKTNPAGVVQDVYRAVGVDPGFTPDLDTPHAAGGMPASRLLEGFFTASAISKAVRPWVPKQATNWVKRLRSRNLRQAPPLPKDLKRELTRPFHEDIRKTSELIGRDLQHWL